MLDVDTVYVLSLVHIGPEILAAGKLRNMTHVEIEGNTRIVTYN